MELRWATSTTNYINTRAFYPITCFHFAHFSTCVTVNARSFLSFPNLYKYETFDIPILFCINWPTCGYYPVPSSSLLTCRPSFPDSSSFHRCLFVAGRDWLSPEPFPPLRLSPSLPQTAADGHINLVLRSWKPISEFSKAIPGSKHS
jgi:hypothetical protein